MGPWYMCTVDEQVALSSTGVKDENGFICGRRKNLGGVMIRWLKSLGVYFGGIQAGQ